MLETRRRLFFLAITLVLVVQILQFMPWVLAAPPTPPVAIFTYTPTAPLVNETVTFDGSNSNGTIVTYQWTFDTLGWGSNAICTFVFTQPGTYNVILKVIDENELLNTTSKNITVYAPPVAVFTYSVSEPLVNETVTFNASESYDFDGSIVSYSWDFGDETNGTGVTVNHTYLVEGNYTVVLNVNDNDGFTNSTLRSKLLASAAARTSASLNAIDSADCVATAAGPAATAVASSIVTGLDSDISSSRTAANSCSCFGGER